MWWEQGIHYKVLCLFLLRQLYSKNRFCGRSLLDYTAARMKVVGVDVEEQDFNDGQYEQLPYIF